MPQSFDLATTRQMVARGEIVPAKAEREAAANRSVDTSDTLKQTVTKATPSVSDETLALFGLSLIHI